MKIHIKNIYIFGRLRQLCHILSRQTTIMSSNIHKIKVNKDDESYYMN